MAPPSPFLSVRVRAPLASLALVLAGLSGCQREHDRTAARAPEAASASSAAANAETPAARAHEPKHYAVAFEPASCEVGKECTATVSLAVKDGFHINDAYPYRFVANTASTGPEFLGKDGAGPHVFSKAAGDFTKVDPTRATLAVHFRSKAKGSVPIAGTYKLSVCSADTCLLENESIEGQVDVR